jgi:hypothetical protein
MHDLDVYQREVWSCSVASRALRSRLSSQSLDFYNDPGSQLLSIVFTLSAAALLVLIVGTLIAEIL